MIGTTLAKEIINTRGKIMVGMQTPDSVVWVNAEKSHLLIWAKNMGSAETGMKLHHDCDEVFLDIDS